MHSLLQISALAVVFAACAAQNQYTTPVPILKQLNRHNEDGSYSYGYEAADGSFKIETKHSDGQVFGKYGYVDEAGKVREVEYGASKRGFEPAGSGINVPPPTLHHNVDANIAPLAPGQEDDGQYREDPSIYYKSDQYNQGSKAPSAFRQQVQQPAFRPQPQQHFFDSGNSQQYYHNNAAPVQYNQPKQQPQQQQHFQQQQQYYNPAPQYYNRPAHIDTDPNLFRGHPATNFDVNSGSYSINY